MTLASLGQGIGAIALYAVIGLVLMLAGFYVIDWTTPGKLTQLPPGKVSEHRLIELVRENFKLTPKGIIESLNLRRPIFKKTAAYGHFGRTGETFTWEATDKAAALKSGAQAELAAK